MPSDAYLIALRNDLDRLKSGEGYWEGLIVLCRRCIEMFAHDPQRVAEFGRELKTTTTYRDEFKEKHSLRVFQFMLFSQGNFARSGGIVARVFGSDNHDGIEIISRTDSALLEGDQMFFG